MANEQNLRKPYSPSEAREMQRKSAKKRSENAKEKKIIRKVLEKRLKVDDLNEIADNLIARAKKDSRDFEILQAALGQKPVDKVIVSDVDPSVIAEVEDMVNGPFVGG